VPYVPINLILILGTYIPPEIILAGEMRKGFETREGHLGKVKAYVAGRCCLHVNG